MFLEKSKLEFKYFKQNENNKSNNLRHIFSTLYKLRQICNDFDLALKLEKIIKDEILT